MSYSPKSVNTPCRKVYSESPRPSVSSQTNKYVYSNPYSFTAGLSNSCAIATIYCLQASTSSSSCLAGTTGSTNHISTTYATNNYDYNHSTSSSEFRYPFIMGSIITFFINQKHFPTANSSPNAFWTYYSHKHTVLLRSKLCCFTEF